MLQDPALTGLESSVVNNEGYGVEPFRASVSSRLPQATRPCLGIRCCADLCMALDLLQHDGG